MLTSSVYLFFWLSPFNRPSFTLPSKAQDYCESYAVSGVTWASPGDDSPHVRPVQLFEFCFSLLAEEFFLSLLQQKDLSYTVFCSAYSYSVDHLT